MGILLLLMTICGTVLAVVLLVYAFWTDKNWLKSFVLGGVIIWFTGYAILLAAASLFSEEKTLGLNEPKEFCGAYFDCHMHAAVTDVRKTKTLGDKTARGEFYIVKVKVFSDAKRAELGLHSVEAKVVDEQEREFTRDLEAEKELGKQPPFEKRISPVESFEKEIVFDLPGDARAALLDLRDGRGIDKYIEAVLIGDEDNIGHRRKYFSLEQTATTARF